MRNLSVITLFLSISLLIAGKSILIAQYAPVPNYNFSQWDTVGIDKPLEWIVNDYPIEYNLTTSISEDAALGDLAVKLQTAYHEGEDEHFRGVLGLLKDGFSPYPWTEIVDSFYFSMKYDIGEGDAALAAVFFIAGDSAVATVFKYVEGSSDGQWVDFVLPFIFEDTVSDPIQPEGIQIIFVSSAFEPAHDNPLPLHDFEAADGSWIIVDNVYFKYQDGDPVFTPNHSFEEWEFTGTYEARNWESANLDVSSDSPLPVTKYEDAGEGITAVRIEVMRKMWGSNAGYINLVDDDFNRGVPYTDTPTWFTFLYNYQPEGDDNALINVNFNGMDNGNYVTNWYGHTHNITGATEGFIQGSFQMHNPEGFLPDRLFIGIEAGNNDGSVLYITNLQFAEITNVTFRVNDDVTGDSIPNAGIVITGQHGIWHTGENGRVTIGLPQGSYEYKVTSMGYQPHEAILVVGETDFNHQIDMIPYQPDPDVFLIRIVDGDADKVYFQGNFFKAEITLPSSMSEIPDGATLIVEEILFTGFDPVEIIESVDVFEGNPVITPLNERTFTIEGNIAAVDQPGVIGLKITAVDIPMGGIFPVNPPVSFPLIDTYDQVYYGDMGSDKGMAFVGIAIPDGDILSVPEFHEINDLYNTDNGIAFTREGHGSLWFPWLNIIDNRHHLSALSDGLNIIADPSGGGFYVEINPATLSFLTSLWVNVKLHNIPEGIELGDISILQTSFGETAGPSSATAHNTDNYALDSGIFEFNVHGFSRYSLKFAGEPTHIKQTGNATPVYVFPNPFMNEIKLSGETTVEKIIMTDLSGKTVLHESLNAALSMDTSGIPSGFFIVTLIMENGERIYIQMMKK